MNDDNIKAQMKKGVLELCILFLLSKNSAYSNELVNMLKKADLLVVEGTLYPLLARLKNEGYLNYKWIESKSGPPRKYYYITEKGKSYLSKLISNWEELVISVNTILKNRDNY